MDVHRDYPFCNNHVKDIDHMFMQCSNVNEIWATIEHYTTPIKSDIISYIGLNIFGSTIMYIKKYSIGFSEKYLLLSSRYGLTEIMLLLRTLMLNGLLLLNYLSNYSMT